MSPRLRRLGAADGPRLSRGSRIIITHAFCGFSNVAALGILVGGLSAMAPARRGDILAFGPRSILAGLVTTCLTGCVIGILT